MSTKPPQRGSTQKNKLRKLQLNKETVKDLSANNPEKIKAGAYLAWPQDTKGCSKG